MVVLTVVLMGTVGELPVTKLEDGLRGHLTGSLERSLVADLSASLPVSLKVEMT
jgi:hypothetical protein